MQIKISSGTAANWQAESITQMMKMPRFDFIAVQLLPAYGISDGIRRRLNKKEPTIRMAEYFSKSIALLNSAVTSE